jgi:hypothetical protein
MLFSVIYSFDCPPDTPVSWAYPEGWRKLWDLTECDISEHDDNDHLGCIGRWKHRKIVALLSKVQFLDFVDSCDMVSVDVETMGSIGSPGFGMGWAPAISFDSMDYLEYWGNAYVTPIPFAVFDDNGDIKEVMPDAFPLKERHWNRVRSLIVEKMGY